MQKCLSRQGVPRGEEVEEALIHDQHRAAVGTAAQQLLHHIRRRDLPCGVVGLAEEHGIDAVVDGIHKVVRHGKVIFFPQNKPLYVTIHRFQRSGVLGKGRRGQQGTTRAQGQRQAEDQICRAVAAQNLRSVHALCRGQLSAQCPAERVRVAIRHGQCRCDGRRHARGQPQRADVGRKIQRVPAKRGPIARPVAAVYQFHSALPHKTSISRTASPSARASRLSAYIMRLARRMSRGSISRSGSPIVGLS